jgi:hypothetical protein
MATGSIPYQALKKARAADTLALSQPVFDEVFDVLHRPRLADNKYLELALAAQAATIVSSDQVLLVLQPWRGSLIQRPAEYLARETPLNPQFATPTA